MIYIIDILYPIEIVLPAPSSPACRAGRHLQPPSTSSGSWMCGPCSASATEKVRDSKLGIIYPSLVVWTAVTQSALWGDSVFALTFLSEAHV